MLLPRVLESIFCQTYQDYTVIVVDDGSVDHTQDVVEFYKKKMKIRYVYQQNQGLASARNKGVANVSGEYVIFVDDDDVLLPYTLEIGVMALNANPKYGIVYSDVIEVDEQGNKLGLPPIRELPSGDIYEEVVAGRVLLLNGAFMVRKALLRDVLFDPELKRGEDVDFACRITEITKALFLDKPILKYTRYLEREKSLSGEKYITEFIERRYKKIFESKRFCSTSPAYKRDIYSKYHFQLGRSHMKDQIYFKACQHILKSIRLSPFRGNTYKDLAKVIIKFFQFILKSDDNSRQPS